MGCLLALLALITPRVIIIILFLFTGYLHAGYAGVPVIWPILGFFFLPLTTLAYAFAINTHGSVSDLYLVLVIVAILIDIGSFGGGATMRTNPRR
jgi:hypothetical protein